MSSISMYLQTPKRPNLPPTPLPYGSNNKTSLPPLSSILSNSDEVSSQYNTMHKLPSVDSLTTPNTQTGRVPSLTNTHYLPQQYPFRHPVPQHTTQTPSKRARSIPTPINTNPNSSFDTSDNDISINGDEVIVKKAKVSPANEKSYAFISHSPVTFPSQEPSIDNAPLARRKRRRTSPNELSILNNEFEIGQTPNKLRRLEIAEKVSMTEKAVQIWFQNKRQSLRKQTSVEKEITELPSTVTISTPIKPTLQKSESQPFIPSPSAFTTKQRPRSATSIPIAQVPQPNTDTPLSQRTVFSALVTPNSSYINYDESNTSIESTSPNLILNETSKKQPVSLNSNNSSTMTFKLMPAKSISSATANKLSQKLANESQNSENNSPKKRLVSKSADLKDLLNSASTTPSTKNVSKRVPLGELDTNTSQVSKPTKKQNEKECIKNLLSLRAGNWK